MIRYRYTCARCSLAVVLSFVVEAPACVPGVHPMDVHPIADTLQEHGTA